MNNFIKLFAFVCMIFSVSMVNAQASKTATVAPDGLIVLDASTDLASEYVANISRFNFASFQEASSYFEKYVTKTAGRGMSFFFDIPNQKMIIYVDGAKQLLVPKRASGQVTAAELNFFLNEVHKGRI
ncbi:MAG: hypothetical protein IT266_09255 [Saprospiraceae bacterium]|nr:hypothetical protein [Saprospiraceae bacterium]